METIVHGPVTVRGPVHIIGQGTEGGLTTDHDAIYVWPSLIESGTAALVTSTGTGNVGAYWAFDQTTLERVKFSWKPPTNWEGFAGRVGFIAPATGGGSVTWRWKHNPLLLGGNPADAVVTVGAASMAGPTGLGAGWTYGDVAGSAVSPIAIPSNLALYTTEIERVPDGSAGTDDMAGDAGLIVVTMTRY